MSERAGGCARFLVTIPGISYYSALLITSELGDTVDRFPASSPSDHLRGVLRLARVVHTMHSSGWMVGEHATASVTKQGSGYLSGVDSE
jgi:hypothetical protein